MWEFRYRIVSTDNRKKGPVQIIREELRDRGGIIMAKVDRDFTSQYFNTMTEAKVALDKLNESLK